MGHADAYIADSAIRFRFDTSGETWADEFTTTTVPASSLDDCVRGRWVSTETAGAPVSGGTAYVQWRRVGGTPAPADNTGDFQYASSAYLSEADATTQQHSSGTFTAGEFTANNDAAFNITANGVTETECGLTWTSSCSPWNLYGISTTEEDGEIGGGSGAIRYYSIEGDLTAVTGSGPGEINCSWSALQATEKTYWTNWYYSVNGGTDWTEITGTNADLVGYVISGLTPGASYDVMIGYKTSSYCDPTSFPYGGRSNVESGVTSGNPTIWSAEATGTMSTSGGEAACRALPGAVAKFDWAFLAYAGSSNWSNPGDGNNVSQWDDDSGNDRHLTEGTSTYQPIFRSSTTALNNQPTVEFDATDDDLGYNPASETILPSSDTSTQTYVWIGTVPTGATTKWFLSLWKTGSAFFSPGLYSNTSNQGYFSGYDSSALAIWSGNGNKICIIAVARSTGRDARVNEFSYTSGTSGTQQSVSGIRLNSQNSQGNNPTGGHRAFVGLYEGDLTAAGNDYGDFRQWVQETYAIDMALSTNATGTMSTSGGTADADILTAWPTPITDITWQAVYWADDPNWSNPGDGNEVSSWPDGSGNDNTVSQATSTYRPLFRSSETNLNSRACVDFDGSDDRLTGSSYTALGWPCSLVWVGYIESDAAGATHGVLGSAWDVYLRINTSFQLDMDQTGSSNAVVIDSSQDWRSNAVFIASAHDGTVGTNWQVNATTDTGTLPYDYSADGVAIGAADDTGGWPGSQRTAFFGIYDGDILADGNYDALVSWVETYYGITTSAGETLPVTPESVAVTPVALGITQGAATADVTPESIAVTPVALGITPSTKPLQQDVQSSLYNSTDSPKSVTVNVKAGELIVVFAPTDYQSDPGFTISDDDTNSWTNVPNHPGSGWYQADLWYCVANSTNSALGISVTSGGGFHYGITAWVYASHNGVGVTPIGNNTGIPTVTGTVVDDSSLVFGSTDYNALDGSSRTWLTVDSQPAQEDFYYHNGSWYAIYIASWENISAGSRTWGLALPTNQKWTAIGLEIKPYALNASPESIAVTGVAQSLTQGTSSVDITPESVAVTPVALGITQGAATADVTPESIAVTPVTLAHDHGDVDLAASQESITVTGVALGITNDVTAEVTPESIAVTPVALGITQGTVTVDASPESIAVTPVALGIQAAATVAITPESIPVAPQTLDRTQGTVTVAITPESIPVAPQTLDRTQGTASVAVTPDSIAVTPVTPDRTQGAATADITPESISITGVALGVTNQVEAPVSPESIAVTPVALGRTQGTASVAVTPESIGVTPVALDIESGASPQSIPASPETITVTPVALSLTATTSVDASPASVAVDPQALNRSQGAVSVSASYSTVTITPQSDSLTTGTVNLPITPESIPVAPQSSSTSTGSVSASASPSAIAISEVALDITQITPANLPLTPVSIPVTSVSLSQTPGAASVPGTPSTITVTSQALTSVPGGNSVAVSPTSVSIALPPLGRSTAASLAVAPLAVAVGPQSSSTSAGSVSLSGSPSVVAVTSQTLDRSAATPIAVAPSVVAVTATALTATATTSVAASYATIPLAEQSLSRTTGTASVPVSPGSIFVSPRTCVPQSEGSFNLLMQPLDISVTSITLGESSGAVSISGSPGSIPLVGSSPSIFSAAALDAAPTALTVSPQGQQATPGAVSVAAGVSSVAVNGLGLDITNLAPGILAVTPTVIDISSIALGASAGGVSVGLSPGQIATTPVSQDITSGSIAILVIPTEISINGSGLTISSGAPPQSISLIPANVISVPVAFSTTAGTASTDVSPSDINVTPQAETPTPGSVSASLNGAEIATVATSQSLSATVSLTPGVTEITLVPQTTTSTNFVGVGLSPSVISLVGVQPDTSPGGLSIQALPSIITLSGVPLYFQIRGFLLPFKSSIVFPTFGSSLGFLKLGSNPEVQE